MKKFLLYGLGIVAMLSEIQRTDTVIIDPAENWIPKYEKNEYRKKPMTAKQKMRRAKSKRASKARNKNRKLCQK